MSKFSEALARRAEAFAIDVPKVVYPAFEAYFGLLARWNRTVNLTALPVDDLASSAIDRLLLEPAAAVAHLPPTCSDCVDLGSGGGSPAIPLKLLRPGLSLTMIEARTRKVAFLREVIRQLELDRTRAEAVRFEALSSDPDRWSAAADLVTARAVKTDATFLEVAGVLLRPGGFLALFESASAPRLASPRFEQIAAAPLLPGELSQLTVYKLCA